VVAGGSGLLAWAQIRRERRRWLVDVKVAWALELHRARLASYPAVFAALAPLSSHNADQRSPEIAAAVARDINDWFYSAGGMCADATTRGAILGLRGACNRWATEGQRPADLSRWRNLAIACLRRDLDVGGLESYDFDADSTMLNKLTQELNAAERNNRTPVLPRAGQRTGPVGRGT